MSSKNTKTKTNSKSQSDAQNIVSISGGNTIVEKKMENSVVEKKKMVKNVAKQVEQVEQVEQFVEKPIIQVENQVVQEQNLVKKGRGKKVLNDEEVKVVEQPEIEQQIGGVFVEEEDEEEQDVSNSKLRYFKLLYNEEVQGRYCGKKPKQAANKAFSSIIKDYKKNGVHHGGVNVDINFSIRECTRTSKHKKEYKYIGKRESLDTPVKVNIKNIDGTVKEIEYKFHNRIQKAPKI